MKAAYCGLDVHKESTYATVLDQTGQVVTQRRMRNEEVPEFLEPLNIDRVAMEASTYIILMYRRLVEDGYNVILSHPKKTRYIAKARIKSDRVDSKALAELMRLDLKCFRVRKGVAQDASFIARAERRLRRASNENL